MTEVDINPNHLYYGIAALPTRDPIRNDLLSGF
jgi:hypothetical protein